MSITSNNKYKVTFPRVKGANIGEWKRQEIFSPSTRHSIVLEFHATVASIHHQLPFLLPHEHGSRGISIFCRIPRMIQCLLEPDLGKRSESFVQHTTYPTQNESTRIWRPSRVVARNTPSCARSSHHIKRSIHQRNAPSHDTTA